MTGQRGQLKDKRRRGETRRAETGGSKGGDRSAPRQLRLTRREEETGETGEGEVGGEREDVDIRRPEEERSGGDEIGERGTRED